MYLVRYLALLFNHTIDLLTPNHTFASTFLAERLRKEGITADIPHACIAELSESIMVEARQMAEIGRRARSGGVKRTVTSVRSWIIMLVQNQAPEIARVYRGQTLRSYDIVDPEFSDRVSQTLKQYGVTHELK